MALPPPRPEGTAVVTGASSGIGAEIARQLASKGYGVTLVARREDRLKELAAELAAQPGRIEIVAADVSVDAERAALLATIEARGLAVDVLVNNAGVGTSGPVHAADVGRERAMLQTNVEALADLTTRVLPAMVAQGSGAVLNVASTAAFQPLPGQAAYSASKAFVLAYSQAIGAELKGTGVTITALCPGPVETGFGQVAGISHEEAHVLPDAMWVSAADVAKAGIDGLARGRAVVIPGTLNRVGAVAAQLTPRRVIVPILARRHPSLKR